MKRKTTLIVGAALGLTGMYVWLTLRKPVLDSNMQPVTLLDRLTVAVQGPIPVASQPDLTHAP